MPSGKKKCVFEKDECELVITRVTPMIHSIIVKQKCVSCGKDTGLGYYSSDGKQREKYSNSKCENCLQKLLDQAFKNDKSHIERLVEN
jgi:DNA-directed RNA polymerase subunit RPC12/RpoP